MKKFNDPKMMPTGSTDNLSEKRKKRILEEIMPILYENNNKVIEILESNENNIRKAERLSEYAGTHIFSGETAYIKEIYDDQKYTTEKIFIKD